MSRVWDSRRVYTVELCSVGLVTIIFMLYPSSDWTQKYWIICKAHIHFFYTFLSFLNLPVNLKQCPVASLRSHAPTLISLPPSLLVPTVSSSLCSAVQSPHWLPNCPHLVRHQQLARQTWGTVVAVELSCPQRPTNLCAQFPQQLQPLFMNKRDQTRLIFITTPPWPLPHHHSNHHCALSLSGADTWPAPDGHRPAWPLNPAALNWNHRWALPLPALNWQTSCCDLGEEKNREHDDNVSA